MIESAPHDALPELVESMLDDTLDVQGWAVLDGLLRDSPAARDYYLQRAKLHVLLSWEVNATEIAPPAEEISPGPATEQTPVSRWPALFLGIKEVASNYTALSLLVSGIFMSIVLLSLALIVLEWKPLPLGESATRVVAEITATHQTVWNAASDGHLASKALLVGDRLLLDSGFAEVTFVDGAVVLLEGPAELVIDDEKSGTLPHGRLAANVPPAAVGFVLRTPLLTVTDLGTEFGLEALDPDASRVIVYQGRVNVEASSTVPGEIPASALLTSGTMAIVTRAHGLQKQTNASEDNSRIVRRLADIIQQPQSTLVALWRFDDPQRLGHDEVGRLAPLTVVGEARHDADGRFGGALALNGNGDMLTAGGSLRALPAGQSPYTVAAWIKPTDTGSRGIVGWGAYGTAGRTNALRTDGDNGFVHYWWGAEFGNDLVVSGEAVRRTGVELISGDWIHVAASWDGQLRRFYVNGRLLSQDQPPLPLVAAAEFSIGRTAPMGQEFFAGRLDDVAIFQAALPEAAIQSIMNGDFTSWGVSNQ